MRILAKLTAKLTRRPAWEAPGKTVFQPYKS